MSHFFIDRPIFAAVLSIVITLTGGVALSTLPLAQYPNISPPTVQVDAKYPGASAVVVAETVAAPIEQQVNGVENMLYMSSQCTNDGSYNLTVTFDQGVDLNMAQVLVQNRVNLAMPLLPDVIKQAGVTTRKRSPDILLSVNINSPTGRYDQLYLSNYATIRVRDELLRLPGVSDVTMLGQRDYSMRVWLDPEQLASRNMTAGDVVAALREQNVPVATGALAQQPALLGAEFQTTLTVLGRLKEPEQFGQIVLRTTPMGAITKLRDVARIEVGAKDMGVGAKLDGKESVGLAIFQLPDANALATAELVRAKMDQLQLDFPEGVTYDIQYDTTPYTRESIFEVFKTLRDAVVLVAIVMLVFLQNWRSAVIPLIAVPVAIIGTFAVMAALGFSLNNLTLFGLVLAIGIVVDDAIVVVEAVEHHIEHGLSPREATRLAMDQVSGPVVAVGLVLSAVFVPCAFISGITGQFFRQFALTIAVSTIISAFNSLTLSPALAALLLRPRTAGARDVLPKPAYAVAGAAAGFLWLAPWLISLAGRLPSAKVSGVLSPIALTSLAILVGAVAGWFLARPINWALTRFFALFEAGFRAFAGVYVWLVERLLRVSLLVLAVYCGLLGLTAFEFLRTPKGFIPSQDMGYFLVNVQLPDAASFERTEAVMQRVQQMAMAEPGVQHTLSVNGQSFLLSAFGSNFGSMFVLLDEFADRRRPDLYSDVIAARLRKAYAAEIYDAQITVFGPPPVRGVGRAGGFRLMIEDRGDAGPGMLQGQTDNLVEKGNQQPGLVGLFSVYRANSPQIYVDIDRRKALSMGVSLKDVFDALQVYLGSLYVNDINLFGRTWQVIVQSDADFRDRVEDVKLLKVRNNRGDMVPLGTLADLRQIGGPLIVTRYNMYPASSINGNAAPGFSSRQAIDLMRLLSQRELVDGMTTEWTEMAYLELMAGSTAMQVFGFAVIMVFLVLAAQYESWSLPLAVILVVPMCLLSAVLGVNFWRQDINIFTQVGFVVLVGLASKNAILIVEFARARRLEGISRSEATLSACRLRLRPIIMTSFAFILGVFPLLIAVGAGAEMRRALGSAVFGGMLGVTFFGIVLTPVFFYLVDRASESPAFQSRLLRRFNAVVLPALGLEAVRQALRDRLRTNGDKRPD
ncbi:MAG TPA: multidrug efflux RND transporter permease subunit [Pirellulales bacterium]|nr:multidrug efflux RND transporter permease subunit [Pirellulales bacterium]